MSRRRVSLELTPLELTALDLALGSALSGDPEEEAATLGDQQTVAAARRAGERIDAALRSIPRGER
jgi:hypothetical protein